jgi:hypothetical protein
VVSSKRSSKVEFRLFVGERRDKNGIEPQQNAERNLNVGVPSMASLSRVAVSGYIGTWRLSL